MDKIRILLADDHSNVRTQIRTRLARELCFEIVGEAADSRSAVECARDLRPQLVLIDPMMHDGLGLEAIAQIRDLYPAAAIVTLTAFADTALKIELRKLGVSAILDKGLASDELVRALQSAVPTVN